MGVSSAVLDCGPVEKALGHPLSVACGGHSGHVWEKPFTNAPNNAQPPGQLQEKAASVAGTPLHATCPARGKPLRWSLRVVPRMAAGAGALPAAETAKAHRG
eukprot:TRINITY_DN899_c1_g1_i1.p2 TRINITY_DN899_c1_g1~~TRINITY_DN899_c1_g1_i1.p2  ORF type:complete len:102 (-),score=7.21 TRINITY_DN899_c1_g1_i1:3-308(-)